MARSMTLIDDGAEPVRIFDLEHSDELLLRADDLLEGGGPGTAPMATRLRRQDDTQHWRSARNSPLSVTVGDRTLALTTKWVGKANALWLALSPSQRLECEDYLPSLPPQSGFIASKAVEWKIRHC